MFNGVTISCPEKHLVGLVVSAEAEVLELNASDRGQSTASRKEDRN